MQERPNDQDHRCRPRSGGCRARPRSARGCDVESRSTNQPISRNSADSRPPIREVGEEDQDEPALHGRQVDARRRPRPRPAASARRRARNGSIRRSSHANIRTLRRMGPCAAAGAGRFLARRRRRRSLDDGRLTPIMTAAMPRLALYQPDIPQNTGTMLRLAACLGVAGRDRRARGLRRVRPAPAALRPRLSGAGRRSPATPPGAAFEAWRRGAGARLVLATTRGRSPYTAFAFRPDDVILVGRESAGVPDAVHAAADARVVVPMRPGLRSLNVAVAAAMILGEALRQTGLVPRASRDEPA